MTKVVAVTGAGSGIGRAVAHAFAEEGYRVAVCDLSRERLELTLSELGPSAHGEIVDVSDFESVSSFLENAFARDGQHVLVNNAGVFDGYAGVEDTSRELWSRVLHINLTGCFYGCKIATQQMTSRGWGRIINIGSVASFRGRADGLAYSTSKAAMLGLTRRLAVELGPQGVTANIICPGTISTDIRPNSQEILTAHGVDMNRGVGVGLSQDLQDFVIPAGRRGTTRDVATLALFLASEQASYINGQAIGVDGGWLAA